MQQLADNLAPVIGLLAVAGVVQALAAYSAVWHFVAARQPVRPKTAEAATTDPGVTVLKPLYGDEPMLEAALASACAQDYAPFQVVFGVQNPCDAAIAVVERVRARFPAADIALVVDDTANGTNRKVANLVNMLPAARHDIIVIADSDVHVAPDWLARVVEALHVPGTGLVTAPYAGLVARDTLAARLGAHGITHGFLPGSLLARRIGRQDCLGATMALRREVLDRIGGLRPLLPHLADDYMLGKAVRGLGLSVRMAATLPATTVAETDIGALFHHELRWGRTIRALLPVAFSTSMFQYGCVWAMLALVLSGLATWAIMLFLGTWAVRAAVATGIDRAVAAATSGAATPASMWLLPVRDLLSMAVLLASYAGDRVVWRGRVMQATGVADAAEASAPAGPPRPEVQAI